VSGWPIVGWAALALGLLFGALLAIQGTGPEGVREVLLASAKTSALLFLAAFLASPLRAWRRNALTRWLLRNRRYVGVSFGVSHAYHLAAIVANARVTGQSYGPAALVFGGFGYVLLAAMVATSNDAAVARLGVRRWRRLHVFGLYYLWFIFAYTFLGSVLEGQPRVAPAAFAAVFAVALVARLWLRRRGAAPRRDGVVG
jgi:DMSO/TMAO reductase YedYZ heme-binding membrane subunit